MMFWEEERFRDPYAIYTSDVIDSVPFFGVPPRQGDGLEVILPEVDFSDMPLAEVLVRIGALCNQHSPDSSGRGFRILLDAPSRIARKPITLHLVDAPVSEAIRAAAEAVLRILGIRFRLLHRSLSPEADRRRKPAAESRGNLAQCSNAS